jgi:putative phosphoesterase
MDIGVISDTHGLVRPEALAVLEGSDLILHAGDVGSPDVLSQLQEVAPVKAVRGNVDKGEWANSLPMDEAIEVEGKYLYMIHNIEELDLDPVGQFDAVVFGHSHHPKNELKDGVLYFNPGSAGPRRFTLPIAVGRITLKTGVLVAEVVKLDVPGAA